MNTWLNMQKLPLALCFLNSLSDYFHVSLELFINVHLLWFSLVSIAPGLPLCLLSITSSICLTSRVLLGESHQATILWLMWVLPLLLRQNRRICVHMYVIQPVPRSDKKSQNISLSPFWQTSLPRSPFFILPLCIWHKLWEMPEARHGLWMLLLCNDKCSLLPSPLLYCWTEHWWSCPW